MADRNVLIDIIVNGHNNAKGALDDAIKGTDKLTKEHENLTKELKKENRELGLHSKSIKEINNAYKESEPILKRFQQNAGRLSEKFKEIANRKVIENLSEFKEMLRENADEVDSFAESVKKYIESEFKLVENQKALEKAYNDTNAALKRKNKLVEEAAEITGKHVDVVREEVEELHRREQIIKDNSDAYNEMANEQKRAFELENDHYTFLETSIRTDQKKLGLIEQITDANDKARKAEEENIRVQERALQVTMDRMKLDDEMFRQENDRNKIGKGRDPFAVAPTEVRRGRDSRFESSIVNGGMLAGIRDAKDELDSLDKELKKKREIKVETKKITKTKHEIADTNRELGLLERTFARAMSKLTGEEYDNKSLRQYTKSIRGLNAELRGMAIAYAIKNVQGLNSVVVGAAGSLVSLASTAIGAGAALGGALAAGAAQAIGPLSIIMGAMGRFTQIKKVLNLKDQIDIAGGGVAAPANAAKDATDKLSDATKKAAKEQRDYNDAIKEAKRNLEDMRLEQLRANLAVEDAQRNLDMALLGSDTAAIATARLDLRDAKLKARRAGQDNRQAQKAGVQGDPGVIAAREALAKATRDLSKAEDGLASAGGGATAAQGRLDNMLGNLTKSEQKVVASIENIKKKYKEATSSITDIIMVAVSGAIDRFSTLLDDKKLLSAFTDNANALATAIGRVSEFATSSGVRSFIEVFTNESTNNIPKITDGLLNLATAFMGLATSGTSVFNEMLNDIVKLTGSLADATANSDSFMKESLNSYRSVRDLLGSIWDLFKVIWSPSNTAGIEMISTWTINIQKFVDNLKENPDAVSKFFSDSTKITNEVLSVIWELLKAMYELTDVNSVTSLADFLKDVLIPALKDTITVIGLTTKAFHWFFSQPLIAPLAKMGLTIIFLNRAFEIFGLAITHLTAAFSSFGTMLVGGRGLLAGFKQLSAIVLVIYASMQLLTTIFGENSTAVKIATHALEGLAIALTVLQVGKYITAMRAATAETTLFGLAQKRLSGGAVGGMFGLGGAFGKSRVNNGNPMLQGYPVGDPFSTTNRFKSMSRGKKIGVGVGAAATLGAGIAAGVIQDKNPNSKIAGAGAGALSGAALGATVGSVIPGVGTAVGAGVGAVAGAALGLMKVKNAQDAVKRSTQSTVDALRAQKDAINAVANAKLDRKDAKLDVTQARFDLDDARTNRKNVYDKLKDKGLSDKQIKSSREYREALLQEQRATIALARANQRLKESKEDVNELTKEGGKKVKDANAEIKKNITLYGNNLVKAEKEYGEAKKYSASMLKAYGKNSLEYQGAVKEEKKAQDKVGRATKNYRKELDKLPEAYNNTKTANKVLGRSFDGVTGDMKDLILTVYSGVNSALSQFGATKISLKKYGNNTVLTGTNERGDAESYVNPKADGLASGGWVGNPGQRGRDTVPTMLGKGEAVLNYKQQGIVNSALHNSGISGLGEVFRRTKGSYHFMASGGYAGKSVPQLRAPAYSSSSKIIEDTFNGAANKLAKASNNYLVKKIQPIIDAANRAARASKEGGVGTLDGKRIAKWIIPILKDARKEGVSFGITSGFRSFAEQTRLWNNRASNPNPVARPGTSNHEGSKYPKGAVDVSPYQGLASWTARKKSKLKWYGMGDPVHFSGTGHARGGFVGSFANGGAIPGSGAVPIIAHAGEWILNKGQQGLLARYAGTTVESLRKALGFNTGGAKRHFADGGIVQKPTFPSNIDKTISATDPKSIKNIKALDKLAKALRMLTADNGVFAQLAKILEKFTNDMAASLKKASYRFNATSGKFEKVLSDEAISQSTADNASRAYGVQAEIYDKSEEAAKNAASGRDKARKYRNKYLGISSNASAAQVKKALNKRSATLKKNLKKAKTKTQKKKARSALRKFNKIRSTANNAAADAAAAEQNRIEQDNILADLAEQAYNAQLDAANARYSTVGAVFDNAIGANDLARSKSVLAGANMSSDNAALLAKNTGISAYINELIGLGKSASDPEIVALQLEIEKNTQQIKDNNTATIANTDSIYNSIRSFKSGVYSGAQNFFESLGALTGGDYTGNIASILGLQSTNLIGARNETITSFNKLAADAGITGLDTNLSGQALVEALISRTDDTTGFTTEQKALYEELINRLIDNETAINNNTKQLEDLNNSNAQSFSTTSWSTFRNAVFDGNGGLLPRYAGTIPQMAVGGSVVRGGLVNLHPAEVVLNKNQAQSWQGGHGDTNVYVTSPTEVVDPVYLANKLSFELNNRGI